MGRLSREEVAAFVQQSCAAQGRPVLVTDPSALDRVVTLLGGRGAVPAPRGAGRRTRLVALQSPADLDAGGVQALGSQGARVDRDVVNDRADDPGLLGQVQCGPGCEEGLAVADEAG